MFLLPDKADFLQWQIWHYSKRLNEAKTQKEFNFLSTELKNLCNDQE